MADRWLGRFLDKMEELKLFENTLLVLLSDHGVPRASTDRRQAPDAMYPELTDIASSSATPKEKARARPATIMHLPTTWPLPSSASSGLSCRSRWRAKTSRGSWTVSNPNRGPTSR